ncbi:hypothetical protein TPHA_0G01590 [Tetrapisispora phaffii CBS 4417]|uniref:Uncharacterized protein n=1 Tax=Tetrapisispora phaffii (strain ATCC 24235 / CBS 4417 / NBRC 1672 / NRRL Y-8282 / UCD 70-5) TaxID=1071381 RepID=G8BVR7_TETPH|nr:hypothetical protein TPHA_0G01590 [Tetrapisispora phaffii CBS 4417]CCE63995.1 hypothetical protein TPHA_0G01590 [Tetrapisispora phaffii CBS 4417]
MGKETTKKIQRKLKQRKNFTVISMTILSLFLMGYLSYTYISSDNLSPLVNDKSTSSLLDDSNANVIKHGGNSKQEIELNSIKVEEQISTIRNGMNLVNSKHSMTSQHINTKPTAVQAPNDYNNGYAEDKDNIESNNKNSNSPNKGENKNNRNNDKYDINAYKNAAFDAAANYKEIINTSRVVLFMKSSDSQSNEIKKLLLNSYEILPEIAIVDLDRHVQGALLHDYIAKKKILTNQLGYHKDDQLEVPFLVINGVSFVTSSNKNFHKLHNEGLLLQKLKNLAGDSVMISKKDSPSNS